MTPPPVLIAVTDHAAERYRQRVRGSLEAAQEIVARVGAAWAAGHVSDEPPGGASGARGSVYVREGDLVFVCRHDRPRGELVVVTLWEQGDRAAVPRRFTDALRDGSSPRPAGRRARLRAMRPYEGLLTAMVTPFHPDGRVNEEAAVAVARHLLANGSHGLVVAGTTGEAATLTDEEQIDLIGLVVDEVGGDGVIVGGAGSNDTRHAVHLTEAVVAAGCKAVLSVTPYYNKPNRRGIVRHFEEVARAAQGVPVILYNIPGRTGTNMPPDLLAELAQIDGIDALKEANSDQLQQIDGLALLAGNDDILCRVMELGGAGGICVSSHVIGNEMRAVYEEQDPARRAALDADLQDVYSTLFLTANPICVKAALNMLGLDAGTLRLPLVDADEHETEAVRGVLERHGLLQPTPSRAA